MSASLTNSILALDAYNRGYNASLGDDVSGLGGVGSKVSNFTILTDSTLIPATAAGKAVGFYVIAYKDASGTITISYRGTDGLLGEDSFGSDLWNGYGIGVWGSALGRQAELAIKFYQSVALANPGADISFTGHSMGGGLAALTTIH